MDQITISGNNKKLSEIKLGIIMAIKMALGIVTADRSITVVLLNIVNGVMELLGHLDVAIIMIKLQERRERFLSSRTDN